MCVLWALSYHFHGELVYVEWHEQATPIEMALNGVMSGGGTVAIRRTWMSFADNQDAWATHDGMFERHPLIVGPLRAHWTEADFSSVPQFGLTWFEWSTQDIPRRRTIERVNRFVVPHWTAALILAGPAMFWLAGRMRRRRVARVDDQAMDSALNELRA